MNKNYENIYDAVIVGAGPAGLTASIYMARAKYKTLIVEKEEVGGQIKITSEVVNYPGIPSTSGTKLTQGMFKQAQAFGAEYKNGEVVAIKDNGETKTIRLANGETIETFGVILAPGANPRKIGFPGESEFQGHGVAYCATCDGEFFSGLDIFVVGGGFAAVEEAVFLTKYASKVTILVRGEEFTCAKTVADKALKNPNIEVLFNTEVEEVYGDSFLKGIKYFNNQTNEKYHYQPEEGKTFGVFVFAGYAPATKWLEGAIELDRGYIVTDADNKTNIDGIYAAGDVCIKELRQVVTATSDGAVAATRLEKHVSPFHEKYEIERDIKVTKIKEEPKKTETSDDDGDGFISNSIKEQLIPVFEKFESNINLAIFNDGSKLGNELSGFAKEVESLHSNISSKEEKISEKPYIAISKEGEEANIFYYGVPGGHEFNSFILAMYNLAGPGQELDEDLKNKAHNLKTKDIKVLATLACTMCPTAVVASQKIASLNKNVKASMYVLNDYPDLKEKYNVMSVPCIVIDDEKVIFGKKDVAEFLELLV